ncbi:hypothetical protein ACHAXH_003425 [Discostella pseudostelligera]|jgi:hypothetical protein
MAAAADSPTLRVPFLSPHSKEPSSSTWTLIPKSDFESAYGAFQALHIRDVSAPPSSSTTTATIPTTTCGVGKFQASDVQSLFASLDDQDKSSWCIENKDSHSALNNCDEKAPPTPDAFLDVNNTNQRGYCSFLVQHSNAVKENLLSNLLPMAHLPVANNGSTGEGDMMKVRYGPCIWLFFGKNYHSQNDGNSCTLPGRPEHTDSVTHDGTWHYQLSGTKIWRLRPTTELLQQLKGGSKVNNYVHESSLAGTKRKIDASDKCNDDEDDASNNYIEVECKQGDILVVNTRLWWHSTFIPSQNLPSISYARDFYFNTEENQDACNINKDEENENTEASFELAESSMNNVDGTYAAEDIAADTILFTEHTMPNCELHRSKINPNCQVIELEDDEGGESYMAVVTLRDIKAGEFFSILESDDEDGSDYGEEDELDSGGGEEESDSGEEGERCLPCT